VPIPPRPEALGSGEEAFGRSRGKVTHPFGDTRPGADGYARPSISAIFIGEPAIFESQRTGKETGSRDGWRPVFSSRTRALVAMVDIGRLHAMPENRREVSATR
jgi:hypothetical protein